MSTPLVIVHAGKGFCSATAVIAVCSSAVVLGAVQGNSSFELEVPCTMMDRIALIRLAGTLDLFILLFQIAFLLPTSFLIQYASYWKPLTQARFLSWTNCQSAFLPKIPMAHRAQGQPNVNLFGKNRYFVSKLDQDLRGTWRFSGFAPRTKTATESTLLSGPVCLFVAVGAFLSCKQNSAEKLQRRNPFNIYDLSWLRYSTEYSGRTDLRVTW